MSRRCCICRCLGNTHTDTTALTSSEDFRALIGGHGLRYINQDIAAVLHQVLLFLTEIALSSTVYLLNGVQRVVGIGRTEIDKSITQERLVVACLGMTVSIKVVTIV